MVRPILSLLIAATCWAQPGPSASVSGNVTEAVTGIPMQGAYVQARWKGGLNANTRTDSHGHYALSNLPATTVYVAAVRNGSQRAYPRGVRIDLAPGDFAIQHFALQPASAIIGTISDLDTGASVSGCHVSAFRKVTNAGVVGYIMDIPAGSANTDANTGRFEIADLDFGEYVLFVEPGPTSGMKRGRTCQASAYYENSSRRDTAATIAIAKPGITTVDIRLKDPETHSISGVVSLPEDAEPASMIMITVRSLDLDGPRCRGVVLLRGPGEFRIGNLAEGDYSLLITDWRPRPISVGQTSDKPNSADYLRKFAYETSIRIESHDLDGMEIMLQPTRPVTVRGTVQIEDGAKLPPNTQMILYSTDKEQSIHSGISAMPFEVTVLPGEYWPRLRGGLPQGYAVTHVLAGGKDLMTAPLRVDGEEISLIFVVSSRLGTLTGTAEDDWLVLLFPEPISTKVDDITPFTAIADDDGVFAFKNLPPGRYRSVSLASQDHLVSRDGNFIQKSVAAAANSIEIKAGEITHITLHR